MTENAIGDLKEKLDAVNNVIQANKGKKELLDAKLADVKKEVKRMNREVKNVKEAAIIIRKVAKETQDEIRYYISEIPSLALAAVFNDPYVLDIEFVPRRDKIEADISFVRGGHHVNPLSASGFGAVDVASFGLRSTIMNLKTPPVRKTLILDEAFKHLKGEKENIKVISMIKELSNKLNVQVVMVHDERVPLDEIRKGADRIFSVTMRNRKSNINEV